jgi:F-type H+-transporting ATPase subunit b
MTLAFLGGATDTAALEFFASSGVNIDFDLTFVGQMVVFAALVVVLEPLLFRPVLNLFEEREKRTEGARAEARDMQARAGELLVKYETELERINRVAAEERDRARSETARLEAEILDEARASATEIVEQGRAQIHDEVNKIRFDLGKASERLATEIAGRVLGREVR